MKARANGIEIEYETFGDLSKPAMVFIVGLGGQLIAMDEELCDRFASRGFRVIIFDNRDVGLSTWFDEAGIPDLAKETAQYLAGEPIHPAYTIEDMADDVAGLLDALDVESAHIVGASLGGAIAQTFAFRHPHRSRTLVSIMASSSDRSLPVTAPREQDVKLTSPIAITRDEYERLSMEGARLGWGSGFPFEEERVLRMIRRGIERAFHPEGALRQLVAGAAQGPRTDMLRQLPVPTLVIHGDADTTVPISHGRHVAECVPGARMIEILGMGHQLPVGAWDQVVAAVSLHAHAEDDRRAGQRVST